ncbi:hypothetical protein [uncultured Amnibacterium sp.]|uniref:hypothetical protein n=1 Tax=uncultured Amnibacterium sp. TaxID=1631851 RepID=UPI0035CC28B2
MLATILPVVIWLAVGAVSAVVGFISVIRANRRFRLAMEAIEPLSKSEMRIGTDHARTVPVGNVA